MLCSPKRVIMRWQNSLPFYARSTHMALFPRDITLFPCSLPRKLKAKPCGEVIQSCFFFFLLLLFFVFVFVCRCWETLLLSYCPIYFKTTFEGCWAIWGVGRGETFHQQLIDYYPNWLCAFLFKQHYFLFCFVFNWAVEGPQQSSKNLSRELEIQGLGIPAPVLSAV